MRVLEPSHFSKIKRPTDKGKKAPKVVGSLLLIALLLGMYVKYADRFTRPANNAPTTSINSTTTSTAGTTQPKTGQFKQFSGEEFKQLYRSIAYPNTQQITDPLPITGNPAADARIRQLAESRGYHLTSIPIAPIVKINEPRLDGDDLLQPLAAAGWQLLKASAQKDDIKLSIISAYRSPEYQRNLFMQRLLATYVTVDRIAAGAGLGDVETTLHKTAVPGYSRHHTGYTIDLWCEDGSSTFLSSSCYKWISDNNYLKAKQSGWIPSYPAGTDDQGPEPEPWEYVWVGTERLME